MRSENGREVTQLLEDWSRGDLQALEELMPMVNTELRRLASHYMAGERSGHTLQPTALVNELYLKLTERRKVHWQSRAQFFSFAAQSMRRILVDHARAHRASKRGSGARMLSLDEAMLVPNRHDVDLLALDDALQDLEKLSEQQSRIVELRCFAGLDLAETAQVLGVSERTVSRSWTAARAWLFRELQRP